MTAAGVVDVAVAIVRSPDGTVLVTERGPRQISAGFWELPGGKIEPGETAAAAAARELFEETGVVARTLTPVIAYEHRFPTRRVRLRFFGVDAWEGVAHGREGQRTAWIDPSAPAVAPFLPSNDRILAALGLRPSAVALVAGGSSVAALLARVPPLLQANARLFVVIASGLAPDQRVALTRRIVALAQPARAVVLLVGSPLEARRAGASGVVADRGAAARTPERPDVPLWAASCSCAEDVARAHVLGADVVMIGPVRAADPAFADATIAPLGWERARRIAAAATVPVYFYGGVTSDDRFIAGTAAGLVLPAEHFMTS